ncbi:MAG: SOS response-associated peptidase family protein [Oligoflexia bacterium]|nr:SOS response-associated peptidase family protein [Oligoflexia bacterium]
MCYSAMVLQHLKSLGYRFKARIQTDLFEELYQRRSAGEKLKIPRAMDYNFTTPSELPSVEVANYIHSYLRRLGSELEQELFAQKTRLAEAERKFKEKKTKTAEKEIGIAGRKIEALKNRLEKLRSNSEQPDDSRIYALQYAPVIVWENGERVIKPMRYLCRPAGFPESFDRDYPGCYNARRDSLKNFWKNQYGRNHAILVISSFFENVKDSQGQNRVVQFKPKGFDQMIIPCVWDRWSEKGQPDLYSFALITDDPPKEVRDAGHDRCPIFIKESNIDSWLRPETVSEATLEKILADREKPFYEHAMVA